MRKFIITNPKFTGHIEVLYNKDEQLVWFNTQNAVISDEVLYHFKRVLPVQLQPLCVGLAFSSETTIVEDVMDVSSDDFYEQYPYKRNPHTAKDVFARMTATERIQAYYAAIDYKQYCKRNAWYQPKIAEGWLRKKEFLNDWKKM
jgi:hypothetical protein